MKKPDRASLKRFSFAIALGASLLLSCGCQPKQPPGRAAGYFGETKTLRQLVSEINANNSRIPTLWSRFSYEAWIVDPETKKERYLLEEKSGVLQYRAPAEFRLLAKKTAAGVVLDLGMNLERYWLIAPEPGPDTMWWGMISPESSTLSSKILIPPQGILQVLGISTLNADLLAEPAPVLRFNNDSRVYMLVWVKRQGDRFVAIREVWYDMQLSPVKVLVFDVDGRVVLRADLKKHKPIDADRVDSPRIATVYELFFPESGSRMNLELDRPQLQHGEAPNDNSFRFVKTVPVSKEIRVDE